jgi:hypothetical protein
MRTAFSSSLFGLGGSLVLGIIDLRAGHAQNRFFNEREEWLSEFGSWSTAYRPDLKNIFLEKDSNRY